MTSTICLAEIGSSRRPVGRQKQQNPEAGDSSALKEKIVQYLPGNCKESKP
jgi:hypothetical protein